MAKTPKEVKVDEEVSDVVETQEEQVKEVLSWQEEELLASRANIKERKSDVN